jgi:hypothetical protein
LDSHLRDAPTDSHQGQNSPSGLYQELKNELRQDLEKDFQYHVGNGVEVIQAENNNWDARLDDVEASVKRTRASVGRLRDSWKDGMVRDSASGDQMLQC